MDQLSCFTLKLRSWQLNCLAVIVSFTVSTLLCIFAHVKMKTLYGPVIFVFPWVVGVFVLSNQQDELNHMWRDDSLLPWDSVVLVLSQNIPHRLAINTCWFYRSRLMALIAAFPVSLPNNLLFVRVNTVFVSADSTTEAKYCKLSFQVSKVTNVKVPLLCAF